MLRKIEENLQQPLGMKSVPHFGMLKLYSTFCVECTGSQYLKIVMLFQIATASFESHKTQWTAHSFFPDC